MLTVNEQQYFKSLIDTYREYGYNYYVLQTYRPSLDDNDFEFIIYFSKTKIYANSSHKFTIREGIKIYIDSTLRNTRNNYNSMFEQSSYNGTLEIDKSEHVYTNAPTLYYVSETMYSPDLLKGESINYNNQIVSFSFMFIIIVSLIVVFLLKIFKG